MHKIVKNITINTINDYKNMTLEEFDDLAEYLIPINPFYTWVEENINSIGYKLLKGIISNIVPLGLEGRKYFERIVKQKSGFVSEYKCLYDRLEKEYIQGNIKIKSYLELQYLGFTDEFLDEKYPAFTVIKYFKK